MVRAALFLWTAPPVHYINAYNYNNIRVTFLINVLTFVI